MRSLSYTIFLSVLLVIGTAVSGQAGILAPGLETALETLAPQEEIPVIISLADQMDLKAFKGKDKGLIRAQLIRGLKSKAAATQGPLKTFLHGQGAQGIKSFWIFNGLAVKAKPNLIRALAKHPLVGSIRFDETLSAAKATPAAAAAPEWNLSAIHAQELWASGHTGAGTVVANMDTGVDYLHPDLSGKWRGGTNSWFDPHGEHATPYDASGHGTQTMGLMVGGSASGTAIGVAPDAQWIAVKMFDDAGLALYSDIHSGFQWFLDPDGNSATNDAPDVVNNSWGYENLAGDCFAEFQGDIQALKTAEIAVVFSAGNVGPNSYSSVSPANNSGSLAVGSVDDALNIAYSSSRGPSACDGSIYPEVAAPGVNVLTTDLTVGGVFPDSYVNASGTSFAAPHIAGGMALLSSAFPSRTVAELETALKDSALDLGLVDTDNDYGYGLIDVMAGYDLLLTSPMCTDSDSDGFFAEATCGTTVDCNDQDPVINPDACDIKRDGIDQNCDGVDRTKGKTCPTGGSDGGDTGGSEGKGATCRDGLDNDGDGLTDCADSDCAKNKQCR